jgi:4-hydroxy-tetrahydrodipicolinate synthase
MISRPRGLWTAIATPITSEYTCDTGRLVAQSHRLLEQGCDGLALFGTTGEGPEFTTLERQLALENLLAAGIPASCLIVSASSATPADALELARHATDAGVAGVLLMPPFFIRGGVTDDGVFRFYSTMIDRIDRPQLKILLYHIPGVSGIAVRPPVIRRLLERYAENIIGIKDSGGDWNYTKELLGRFSELSIFTGTEVHIHLALAQLGAGTICGLGNVIAPILRQFFDCPSITERRRLLPLIQKVDSIMSRGVFVACLKTWIAAETGDPGWKLTMPPVMPLPTIEAQHLIADFRKFVPRG